MTNKAVALGEQAVYSKLYDVTEGRLLETGDTMKGDKAAFMKSLGVGPDCADLSLLFDVPMDKYLSVLYKIVLNRLVSDEEINDFNARGFDSDEIFKRKALNEVLNSTERNMKGTIIGNYYDTSDVVGHSVGKAKKRAQRLAVKIKGLIPLKVKVALKRAYLKAVSRGK